MSPVADGPPAIIREAKETMRQLQESHSRLLALLTPVTEALARATQQNRPLSSQERSRLLATSNELESAIQQFKNALNQNVEILGKFLVDDMRLREQIASLQQQVVALQIDAEPADADPSFFTHIRQAIAVIRGRS